MPAEASEGARSAPVLVLDDNLETVEGLAELLRLSGRRVEVAGDGRAGIEAWRRERPRI